VPHNFFGSLGRPPRVVFGTWFLDYTEDYMANFAAIGQEVAQNEPRLPWDHGTISFNPIKGHMQTEKHLTFTLLETVTGTPPYAFPREVECSFQLGRTRPEGSWQ
jgi:hypothetical protein